MPSSSFPFLFDVDPTCILACPRPLLNFGPDWKTNRCCKQLQKTCIGFGPHTARRVSPSTKSIAELSTDHGSPPPFGASEKEEEGNCGLGLFNAARGRFIFSRKRAGWARARAADCCRRMRRDHKKQSVSSANTPAQRSQRSVPRRTLAFPVWGPGV